MEQPKFKFGDKLKHINSPDKVFTVGIISHTSEGFYYGQANAGGVERYGETHLELVKESKKLYAYYNLHDHRETRNIFFNQNENLGYTSAIRAPEFDIEYPENK